MATEPIGSARVSTGHAGHDPVLGAAAVLVGAFLVSFDQRLFAIGLPDLRGAFGLTFDEGTWLATIALAPQLIVAPAIPWLATVLGVRRVLIVPQLTRVSVGDPEITDVNVADKDQLLLEGRSAGTTTLLHWDAAGNRRTLEISVR